ncbi:MAG: nicotinate (nicotinamide) nucleotide adenylyltransferase [Oscillospiraceae bacterium]|nr:nicotinate (nicotinamide) nucleotide adenylyltransferase [Oscillospiraceae bacterium]
MKIAIYGGSFNPPHCGHVEAAAAVMEHLKPDKMLIIPASIPPHKELCIDSPDPQERLLLTRLAFSELEGAEVSDIEIMREGKSYSAETLEQLMKLYPGAEFCFAMGTDMFLSFEQWYRYRFLLENMTLAVFCRCYGEDAGILEHAEYLKKEYGAKCVFVPHEPQPMSSSDIRDMLRRRMGVSYLPEKVYARIIENGDYGAKPELYWLREKAHAMLKPSRVAHVIGCEAEAVQLAKRWGEDPENAAEAGILHDITKKLVLSDQLILCRKYGIINDNAEERNFKLLHAKTGAALARALFGISDEVYNAIRWHTTGKPDMTLLEKIIYMADYIEPNRDFPGVEELRRLAYEDLDKAMALGLEMSLEDIKSSGQEPYKDTVEAFEWYSQLIKKQ